MTGGARSRTRAAGGAGYGGGAEELAEPGPGGAAWQVDRCGAEVPAGGRASWRGRVRRLRSPHVGPFRGPWAAGVLATLGRATRTPQAAILYCGDLTQVCGELSKWRCPRPALLERTIEARGLAVESCLVQSVEAEGCSFMRQ